MQVELSVVLIVPGHFAVEQLPVSLQVSHALRLALEQSGSATPQPQSQTPSA